MSTDSTPLISIQVKTSAIIIKIQNNGRDGDDWSINNIQTGGAGAIGTYISYDEETAQKIKESCPLYKEDK